MTQKYTLLIIYDFIVPKSVIVEVGEKLPIFAAILKELHANHAIYANTRAHSNKLKQGR